MKETVLAKVQATGEKLQVKAGAREFTITFDEPQSSGGGDTGMNPVEGLLCALGACETIATMIFAGMKGVQLSGVGIELEGDIDTDGFMGIDPDVRNGFSQIRYRMSACGPDKDAVRDIVEHANKQCPVADCIANPVPLERVELVVE